MQSLRQGFWCDWFEGGDSRGKGVRKQDNESKSMQGVLKRSRYGQGPTWRLCRPGLTMSHQGPKGLYPTTPVYHWLRAAPKEGRGEKP